MSTTRETVFIYTVTVSYVCVLVTRGISLVQEFRLLTNPGQETRSMGFIDLVPPHPVRRTNRQLFLKKKIKIQFKYQVERTTYRQQRNKTDAEENRNLFRTRSPFFLFVFHPADIFFSTTDCSDRFLATVGALVLRDIISSSQ